eukprot:4029780-Alexandrium_andersonii.AAC.1
MPPLSWSAASANSPDPELRQRGISGRRLLEVCMCCPRSDCSARQRLEPACCSTTPWGPLDPRNLTWSASE